MTNFRANPRDFGLSSKEIEKRLQQFNMLSGEKANLQRTFDSFFEKKKENDLFDINVISPQIIEKLKKRLFKHDFWPIILKQEKAIRKSRLNDRINYWSCQSHKIRSKSSRKRALTSRRFAKCNFFFYF